MKWSNKRKWMATIVASSMLMGCAPAQQPLSTTASLHQQLQTAQLAFTAAEGIVAAMEATNSINPNAAGQISSYESAAVAALAKASADVEAGDSTAQSSLDALDAAITVYSQAIVQLKQPSTTQP
jgi:hypothetical protein